MTCNTKRHPILILLCIAFLMTISSGVGATSFSFSSPIIGGGVFAGSFTILPNPLDPSNFTASNPGPPTIGPWEFSFTGIPNPNTAFNIAINSVANAGFFLQGLTVSNGELASAEFRSNTLGFIYNRSGWTNQQIRIGNGNLGRTFQIQKSPPVAAVPEPGTIALFATGLLGLAGYRWHQRRREGDSGRITNAPQIDSYESLLS